MRIYFQPENTDYKHMLVWTSHSTEKQRMPWDDFQSWRKVMDKYFPNTLIH